MPTGLLGKPVRTVPTGFPSLDDSSDVFRKLDNSCGTMPTGLLGNSVMTMPTGFP
ncbi:hypothetical protein DPMN_089422 [Dreissena polymorpha]|uniref:Uncharacterized protein n=1 Tax=Dreissena polymorpha TaxID=45954 RepID=A0A9D4QY26_DREPO|nr:hypothetical protein DPMN_089422 [Dreissena polymorpha]